EGSATSPAFQTPGDLSIKVPIGSSIPGKATSTVTCEGNLNALAVGPLAQTLISSQSFTTSGAPATAATVLNNLDGAVSYQTGDKILITGKDSDGTTINTSLSVDGTTTFGNLLTALNGAFTQSTASLDARGNLILKANNTGPSKLTLSLADDPANVGSVNFG